MKRKILLLKMLSLLLVLLLGGCEDFIEPSLEGRQVLLLAPSDGTETNKYQVGFWWEGVEDASHYRLQIVSPDFSSTRSLIKDTLIDGRTDYQLTMEPGTYAWRVRAENGSSLTLYSSGSFIVHESSLAEQKVTPTAPGSNYLSNRATVLLSWDKLFGAEGYTIQIDTLNFIDETKLVYHETLSASAFSFTFPKDGSYQWRVQARNASEVSLWSDTRVMTYDRTAPAKPEPVGPANQASVTMPVRLDWTAVPTARRYKLFVYRSDGSTLYNQTFPVTLNTHSYSFESGQPGEIIYWRVLAVDEAGNEGEMTEERSFSIQ